MKIRVYLAPRPKCTSVGRTPVFGGSSRERRFAPQESKIALRVLSNLDGGLQDATFEPGFVQNGPRTNKWPPSKVWRRAHRKSEGRAWLRRALQGPQRADSDSETCSVAWESAVPGATLFESTKTDAVGPRHAVFRKNLRESCGRKKRVNEVAISMIPSLPILLPPWQGKQHHIPLMCSGEFGNRTQDLVHAKHALCQLS